MHVADLDGRIYDRRKRERQREIKFAACFIAFLLVILVLAVTL